MVWRALWGRLLESSGFGRLAGFGPKIGPRFGRKISSRFGVIFGLKLGKPEPSARLQAIYTCSKAGEPMQAQPFVEVIAGSGLAGDRYSLGTGHWHPVESCAVTLISEDDLERARRRLDVHLDQGRHRRNLVVAGVRARDLEGRRVRIGSAVFAWEKPRPPCGYLNQITGENLAKALGRDSGVCLRVIEGGLIRVGDPLLIEPFAPVQRRGAQPLPTMLLLLLLLFATGCTQPPAPLLPLSTDAVILAFGDSLTAGTGAEPLHSYPAQLEILTGRRVVNAGNPGELSDAGVARLPAVLDEYRPELLILTHGGNDLLRRVDANVIRTNLETMIDLAREREIEVLLVAVPKPALLRLRSDPLYAEIGKQFQVPVENGAIAHVLSRDALKADPIHPNGAGYRYLAERIHQILLKTGAL